MEEMPSNRGLLRPTRPGDAGWVLQQHAELYAREWGYDARFETLVAGVIAGVLRRWNPDRDAGWIAELDGQRVGSMYVVRKSLGVAQLRLLILTPQARGLGLGGRLVDTGIAFARSHGYRKLVLWTNGQLAAARAIYVARGFQCTSSERLNDYGQDLVSETWELDLRPRLSSGG